MSISPIITFKAGRCELDTSSRPYKVTPEPTPGYIYLYSEDELVHFCWRERNKTMTDEDNLDLVMFPTDGHFEPYEYRTRNEPSSKTNGRIFALKFSSSSQRHLFWLQSKPQARNGDPSWFSPRDLKIGQIVDTLLQGDEVNVSEEIAQLQGGNDGNEDEDETMEDIGHGDDHHRGASGGAGADATGGDVREEGAEAREGGADGGRAAGSRPADAATVVQNFLDSLKGGQDMQQQQAQVPTIDAASPAQLDNLLSYLPPSILVGTPQSALSIDETTDPSNAGGIDRLSLEQKKSILRRVLRSPQFHQSLGSLTMAIRDGGLPSIADALGIELHNGGLVRGSSMPLGGGDAVEAFIEGVKKAVEKK